MKRFLIRVSAFLRKEIVNIWRQPQLVFVLVLGPFLILFIFGIGFRNEAQPLRTLFIAEQDSPLRPYVEEYATSLGPQLVYEGITADSEAALRRLRNEQVDALVHIPPDAAESIQAREQVVFSIYHNEIDPQEAGYVGFAMNIYVDELNRRVLSELYRDQQEEATSMREDVEAAQAIVEEARISMQNGNLTTTQQRLGALEEAIAELDPNSEERPNLPGASSSPEASETLTETTMLSRTLGLLAMLGQDVELLNEDLEQPQVEETKTYSATLAQIDQDLEELHVVLSTVEELPAPVLLSPFEIQTENITPVDVEMIDFYTPGVLALLLQHVAVSFASLSIVQEKRLGALQLFQVAPVSPFEILLGKYLSHIVLIGIVTALLTLLVILLLGVPMLGSWMQYALVALAVIFTSLSYGFLISLIATTTSQAVQASMILLLASVFFTGFFQGLDFMVPWTQVISWSLPATYGRQFLQDIMLRAESVEAFPALGLVLIGGVLLAVNLIILRSHMVRN